MAYSLLLVTILFCCCIGYGLASIQMSAWAMLGFCLVAMVAIQLSFLLSMMVLARF